MDVWQNIVDNFPSHAPVLAILCFMLWCMRAPDYNGEIKIARKRFYRGIAKAVHKNDWPIQ